MVLLATLRRSGGIEAIARHLAVPPALTQKAVTAAIGPLLQHYRLVFLAHGAGEAGLAGLAAMLAAFGGGQLAVTVMSPGAIDASSGEALLATLFGSAERSDDAIKLAARESGIDEALLIRVAPMLAMLVGGYFAARVEGCQAAKLSKEDRQARVEQFDQLLSGK